MHDSISRRGFVSILGATVVSGCVSSGNSATEEPGTSTATEYECDSSADTPTEVAIVRYGLHVEKLDSVRSSIGSAEQFEVDSVMGGDTIFNTLNCQEAGRCEDRYLTAIEDLEDAKETIELAESGFESLKGYSESCDVDEQSLIAEECDNGIEKARVYVDAIESLIESAKRHVDEDLETFTRGSDFEQGLAQFQQAKRLSLMDPSTLEKKVTVYNG